MKKYDLLKVLGITLLIVALISWVIPAGYYSNGTFNSLDTIAPIGLYDLFRLPVISVVTFIQYAILFLVIGGFYGVLNKTGVYGKLIEKIASLNKGLFLTITTILFALLASVVGSLNLIFVLVPLFIAVLIKMGYSKITAFASTIGAMLVGQIGTTFGFSTWGYFKIIFGIEMFDLLLVRAIVFIMITTLYTLLVRKKALSEINNKKGKLFKKNEKIDIPLHEENKTKKGFTPLIIMLIATFIFLIIGVYNWYYAFEVELFSMIYEAIVTFEFGGITIFNNLLGSVSEIGFFSNYDISVILIISSVVIGWIYSLKLTEILDGFVEGIKEMLKPALYSILACTIFTALLSMTEVYGGNFINGIINTFISGSEAFSLPGTIGSSLVSSFAYNDFYTLVSNISGAFGSFDYKFYPIIAFVFTTMYSVIMLIAPTSVFLIAGLSYLEIPYKEWAKYIWKLLLIIFVIVIIVAFIITAMI